MYYVLYIDVLFLENLLLDYLLLTLLARLMKLSPGWLRKILSAALGSLLLCVIYAVFPRCPLPVFLVFHGVAAVVMVAAGLKLGSGKPVLLARAVILLYLSSFLLGGIFGWLKGMVRLPVYPFLGFSLVSFWLLSLGMGCLTRSRQKERHIFAVTLGFCGQTLKLRGFLDTGNSLRDPISGKPVSLLSQELKKALEGEEHILCYPIPYHSVGKANGLLPAFYADFLQIETEEGRLIRMERPLLGITKEPLSSKKEYDILLHPDLLEFSADPPFPGKRSGRVCRLINSSGGNKDNAD